MEKGKLSLQGLQEDLAKSIDSKDNSKEDIEGNVDVDVKEAKVENVADDKNEDKEDAEKTEEKEVDEKKETEEEESTEATDDKGDIVVSEDATLVKSVEVKELDKLSEQFVSLEGLVTDMRVQQEEATKELNLDGITSSFETIVKAFTSIEAESTETKSSVEGLVTIVQGLVDEVKGLVESRNAVDETIEKSLDGKEVEGEVKEEEVKAEGTEEEAVESKEVPEGKATTSLSKSQGVAEHGADIPETEEEESEEVEGEGKVEEEEEVDEEKETELSEAKTKAGLNEAEEWFYTPEAQAKLSYLDKQNFNGAFSNIRSGKGKTADIQSIATMSGIDIL